jgi:lipoprotein-anchoring transpeptidase ErfK/SrfK
MRNRILFTIVVFLGVANILIWSLLGVQRAYAKRVYPGVWMSTQSLAGLTREQAIDRLNLLNGTILKQKVTLHLKDKTYTPTLQELGYSVDAPAMAEAAFGVGRGTSFQELVSAILDYKTDRTIPLQYSIDQVKFDAYLNDIGKDIVKEPKNIGLTYANGAVVLVAPETGIALDTAELRNQIQRKITPNSIADITLSYHEVPPVLANESQVATAKQQLEKLLSRPLVLQAEEVTESWDQAALYNMVYFEVKDNVLVLGINDDKIQTAVSKFAKKVDTKAVAQEISAVNQSILKEGKDGRELNAPDALKRVKERLVAADTETPIVLGVTKVDKKTLTISPEFQVGRYVGRYAEVDLSSQRMHLIEGDQYHRTFIISTGKWSTPTPIGEFTIKNHIGVAWSQRFGLYMPNWMALQTADTGFYDGYGIHGLPYWPNGTREGEGHLGTPVSHGCIRLGADDIKYMYEWAGDGTRVIIHQ